MTKTEYLKSLHDLIYQANLADSDRAEAWQKAKHAATHCQPLLDIAHDTIGSESGYQVFCDCLGDFASFEALILR